MENIQQMSMLEVAVKLMNDKKSKQPISKIIKETLEMKGIDDEDGSHAAQLYIDITTSSLFVYMGDEEWDLKSRQSLDEWDKDGSAFNTGEIEDDDEEEESADDFILLMIITRMKIAKILTIMILNLMKMIIAMMKTRMRLNQTSL